jgi:hypothetical protein
MTTCIFGQENGGWLVFDEFRGHSGAPDHTAE